jgi:hypothetical protein
VTTVASPRASICRRRVAVSLTRTNARVG